MAKLGGPEQTRKDAAGKGFTDVIKSRAGRTSFLLFRVGVYCVPATLHGGCALEVSSRFRKVVALSGGAARDCHRAPSAWGLKETRQGMQEAEESAAL